MPDTSRLALSNRHIYSTQGRTAGSISPLAGYAVHTSATKGAELALLDLNPYSASKQFQGPPSFQASPLQRVPTSLSAQRSVPLTSTLGNLPVINLSTLPLAFPLSSLAILPNGQLVSIPFTIGTNIAEFPAVYQNPIVSQGKMTESNQNMTSTSAGSESTKKHDQQKLGSIKLSNGVLEVAKSLSTIALDPSSFLNGPAKTSPACQFPSASEKSNIVSAIQDPLERHLAKPGKNTVPRITLQDKSNESREAKVPQMPLKQTTCVSSAGKGKQKSAKKTAFKAFVDQPTLDR